MAARFARRANRDAPSALLNLSATRKTRRFEGCPFRRMWSRAAWTPCISLDIVTFMQLLSGKDAAAHIAGIIHPTYQVHGFSVHLTVRNIYGVDPVGKLDFGGAEFAPAGRVAITPRQLRPEDNYLWWELERNCFF